MKRVGTNDLVFASEIGSSLLSLATPLRLLSLLSLACGSNPRIETLALTLLRRRTVDLDAQSREILRAYFIASTAEIVMSRSRLLLLSHLAGVRSFGNPKCLLLRAVVDANAFGLERPSSLLLGPTTGPHQLNEIVYVAKGLPEPCWLVLSSGLRGR